MLKRKDTSLIDTMIAEKADYPFKNRLWIDFHHLKNKDATVKVKVIS